MEDESNGKPVWFGLVFKLNGKDERVLVPNTLPTVPSIAAGDHVPYVHTYIRVPSLILLQRPWTYM